MQVARGGGETTVAQQELDGAQIGATLEQVHSECVTLIPSSE